MTTSDLRARWERLVESGSEAAAAACDDLLRRWQEPHRRYHTLEHLEAVLEGTDQLLASETAADAVAVELAAWFHDAVYEPGRPDNEAESAALAGRVLPDLGVAPATVDAVAQLVRMTETHDAGDPSGRVLADADLAVLARPPQDYDRYVAAVRDEYAVVPDDAWRRGRARILQDLLARRPLFFTAPMRPLEDRARANLSRELTNLRQ